MEGDLKRNEIVSPIAGKTPSQEMLVDVSRLEREYFERLPGVEDPTQSVSFGTSGHRGSSLRGSFNEAHILVITQAICDYRRTQGTTGPLYMGKDTHALSEPAFASALEVLVANGVDVMVDANNGYTPTPVISHAILNYNRGRKRGLADGIVVTPSHNPPRFGGFKYNPPHGGPADTHVTEWIERQANAFIADGLRGVARIPFERARSASTVHPHQYLDAYVRDLPSVIDLQAIRESKVRISGATFLRRDGTVWTTDKDGLVPNLLASEITARTGKDPGEHYQELTCQFGTPYYTRIDAPGTPEQKARLEKLSPEAVVTPTLAGEPIRDKLTRAPGHGAPIGGLKVVTENGWFAARPSGTENIYKIYAESFKDQQDLDAIVSEAQEIVNDALKVL
jgi:phosphoglucomutase